MRIRDLTAAELAYVGYVRARLEHGLEISHEQAVEALTLSAKHAEASS